MGSIWLRDLANWCRAEGCKVKEWDGWQNRSASQGGFIQVMGVVEHHTASPPSSHGAADWQYATYNNENAPEYNIGIDPDGTVNILAAGGVNSSGKGGPIHLSTGTVPQDGANYRLVAISFGNNGTGETYSVPMMDAGIRATAAIVRHLGMDAGAVTAHKEWCGPGTSTPGRKIDPYGPWADAPASWPNTDDWGPQQGRIDAFRAQVLYVLAGMYVPPVGGPPPDTGGGGGTPPVQPPTGTDWWTPLMKSLPVLRQGATGPSVKRMQHLLAAAGFMNAANVANYDGVFGGGTASALNNFKVSAGGSADGTCDSWTWGALMHTINGIPEIKKGASGDDVRRMQHLLAAAGNMNEANVSNYDGVWGNGTESAKVAFDNAHRLTPSPPSDCGQKSWTSLLNGQSW